MSEDNFGIMLDPFESDNTQENDASNLKFFKVLKDSALEEGEGKVVRAGLKKIALFRRNAEIFAIQDFCPHAGGSLGSGEFANGVVKCPRHGWGFDVATGACLTNSIYEARCYPTRLEDGYILVGVPDDGALV
ncbi:Rieske (2Fe-2S) protein [Bradymonas sediminis]|uniref:Non-heme iron oxygenase ferredoxin subunit n=1 Tax=Bradymonas sediminis TaxID=1548548 RepID=A0A2Z4FJ56_9DELT|nr:Rieske 2Fe-2S domain-containing protein [Bradymonas sediminis]AWV89051.1 non-heme iron oxygenase ferredoxin subunit [Bradymonas sediminis]TDP64487.1 nitrite reductase/ring-hydroxylating ferredoxin subunit [Bradymonas sediminis]